MNKFRKTLFLSVAIMFFSLNFSSCSNAGATGSASTSDSIAAFRVTRASFPQGISINQLDAQCNSEFGSQYKTATHEEARSLAKVVSTSNGIYTLLLDINSGNNQTNCGTTYCAVLCIRN